MLSFIYFAAYDVGYGNYYSEDRRRKVLIHPATAGSILTGDYYT